MIKMTFVALSVAAILPLSVLPASAVTKSSAQTICVKAAAARHSELLGNVQVRGVKKKSSGYEVNMQVKGSEINCMVTSGGKVRYMN